MEPSPKGFRDSSNLAKLEGSSQPHYPFPDEVLEKVISFIDSLISSISFSCGLSLATIFCREREIEMGKKSKSSRKGKKAWRANISTEDIEEYFDKSTKDALSGGSLADVPSDSLFFVDKLRDLSVKRKIDKGRERVLRCDSLLQRNPFVKPIPSSIQKKKKTKKNEKSSQTVNGLDAAEERLQLQEENVQESGLVDLWEEGEGNSRIKKKPKFTIIPAVEVEPQGCSFNPDPVYHKDALATAVADEMQKIYRQELGPEPIPSIILGGLDDEQYENYLQSNGVDDDDPNENSADIVDSDTEKRVLKIKRVTRVELNRRARRKERLKVEAEAKKVEKLSKTIDSLPDIMQEIEKEDEEKQNRHLRRTVAKQERLKAGPPRLGKYKFQPAPLQVLLSEEKTGSLRQLKGCCTLVKDRFKSLEKRGLVIPSKKSCRK